MRPAQLRWPQLAPPNQQLRARRAAVAVSRAARSSTDAAAAAAVTAADLALGTFSRKARSFRCDASTNVRLPLGSDSVRSDSCFLYVYVLYKI